MYGDKGELSDKSVKKTELCIDDKQFRCRCGIPYRERTILKRWYCCIFELCAF